MENFADSAKFPVYASVHDGRATEPESLLLLRRATPSRPPATPPASENISTMTEGHMRVSVHLILIETRINHPTSEFGLNIASETETKEEG